MRCAGDRRIREVARSVPRLGSGLGTGRGRPEWEPFEEGGDMTHLKSLDKRLLELKRDVLQDLLNRARKDIVWYRVLRIWTRRRSVSVVGTYRGWFPNGWDARPQEPRRHGGRPMNLVVVQARTRALMCLLTGARVGNGVLPIDSKSSRNAGRRPVGRGAAPVPAEPRAPCAFPAPGPEFLASFPLAVQLPRDHAGRRASQHRRQRPLPPSLITPPYFVG